MSIYLELTKINIQPRKRSECVLNCSKYCLTLTGGRHRRWCSTQTRSRTGTKCPRQKHPRKLQCANKELYSQFHLCPSLSISDLESHCKTYPLTSWPCGWFSPSQFSPFCCLYTPRTQDSRSLLYSSVQSTLQCPSSSVQERLPSQLRLSSASPLLLLELVCCTTVILCHNAATAATSSS